MGVNKVILVGNVTSEIKTVDVSGSKVAKFSIATNETYKKDGEKVTNTEFHNCVAWKGLAGVLEQYVKKGQQVYIEGKLTHRKYEKDGQTKYFTEVVVSNLEMLGGRTESSSQSEKKGSQQVDNNTDFEETDNLPF